GSAPRPAPLRGDARGRLPRCRAAAPGRRVETRPLRRPSGRVSARRVRYHRRVRGLLGVDSASPSVRFKVGLVQMAMSVDPDANLQTAVAKVAEAAVAGAQLVCLPELFRSRYFAPGDLGFRAFDTRVGRIGTLVCWDQWYPEGARLTALQGAAVLFYPTAIGWHPKEKATHGAEQLDAWRTIQRSHAIANGCYVAAVNRVGHERPSDGNGDGIAF